MISSGFQPWRWKSTMSRLHEHRAAVAEHGHGLGAEGQVGVLLHRHAEALRGGLQEVAVAGGALRVQLEILHAAVLAG